MIVRIQWDRVCRVSLAYVLEISILRALGPCTRPSQRILNWGSWDHRSSRRSCPQGTRCFCPMEINSSCTSMFGSARATTPHCRQLWWPWCSAPGPTSPQASSCRLGSRWRRLLSICSSLGTTWASWQPPPLLKHRSGLQVQCWARLCGLLCSLSKELLWATHRVLQPKQMVLCGTQLARQTLQFTCLAPWGSLGPAVPLPCLLEPSSSPWAAGGLCVRN